MPENQRILIVEDEEGLATHLAFLLKRIHYIPLEPVAYGEQAVECAETLNPDLVLMDINLAGAMNGIQAARIIRDRCGTPVIFLSALAEDDILTAAVGSDPFAYLLKPVKEADLRAAIEVALLKHAMEARLRESESRYRLLFEKMSNGFGLGEIVCDEAGQPVDYYILAMNPAYGKMTNVDVEALVGRRVRESLPDFDSRYFIQTFGKVALTGQSVEFEYFLVETGRFLKISAYSPKPGQFANLVEDITERRLAEQAIKESETRFRQLAEGVSEVFWLRQRATGQMLYVSPAYERVFGRPCADLYENGKSFLDSVHPDDEARVRLAQQALQEQAVPFNEEYRIVRPDGAVRWVWARTFPVVEDSGEITRFSGIAEDITERQLAERKLHESFHRLERSLHRMNILRNVDLTITAQTDQQSLVKAILANMVDLSEIDAAVLLVPNVPEPGRPRGTGPLSALRLAGLAGMAESSLDGEAFGWQMLMATNVHTSGQSLYINDLRKDPQAGAQSLYRQEGFNACAVLPLLARGQSKGVLQFFSRHFNAFDSDWQTFLQSLALQTAIGIDHVEMLENLKRTNRDLAKAYDETIKGWALALELSDRETHGHAERVTELTTQLANAMHITGAPLDHLRRGAFLHDIGKMAMPVSLLTKTGPLTSEEWITMRQHPVIGYSMLSNIEYLKPALDVVLCHHEKWDGSGYPRGLKGEEIPLAARIFAVADVWDALTSKRPYRPAWPESEARNYLAQHSGQHFDPHIIKIFFGVA